ncbi:hypothetical protein IJQ51_00715 [Candidatus Saccharibacteria bacterium]|nr:hypothetical protein [Candidatus Saccharibacteria bacterium]
MPEIARIIGREAKVNESGLFFIIPNPCYLTNLAKISIKSIDKIAHVCYTENKLNNKTKRKTNMAINTYKIPFQYFNNEAGTVSPTEISDETAERIKNSRIGAKVLGASTGRYL